MSLRNWIIIKLGGMPMAAHARIVGCTREHAYATGKQQAKIEFAVLPLPFTPEQLQGREYGTFITPAGFACTFGECNVPAPGQYGYEQRAGYIRKNDFAGAPYLLHPHVADEDREHFIPVIVTVLR